jgi:hypothetical protein
VSPPRTRGTTGSGDGRALAGSFTGGADGGVGGAVAEDAGTGDVDAAQAGAGCRLEVIAGMGHFNWVMPNSPGFKRVAELTVGFLREALPLVSAAGFDDSGMYTCGVMIGV